MNLQLCSVIHEHLQSVYKILYVIASGPSDRQVSIQTDLARLAGVGLPLHQGTNLEHRLAARWEQVCHKVCGGRICGCCGSTGLAIPHLIECPICKQMICSSCVQNYQMALWPNGCACLIHSSEYPDAMVKLVNQYFLTQL